MENDEETGEDFPDDTSSVEMEEDVHDIKDEKDENDEKKES